jgi:S1-C subfamily serine protease
MEPVSWHAPPSDAGLPPASGPDRQPRSGVKRPLVWLGSVLLVFGVAGAAWVAVSRPGSTDVPYAAVASAGLLHSAAAAAASTTTGATDALRRVAALDAPRIAATVIPSVVYVEVSDADWRGEVGVVASGSGVVVDQDGHVATNGHVVTSGRSYRVVLPDGRTYDAILVGLDQTTDLAVLDIDAAGITPMTFGSSDALRVGDPVVAIGSPLGLEGGPSLTVGVVSAFGRQVQTDRSTVLYGMLQTDAAITEGSSGGALVDSDGRLVGITTAVGVSNVGIEGVGFATPVEVVARVTAELIRDGSASQPALGISGTTAFTRLDGGGQRPTGVQVDAVKTGLAAAAAGIRPGDVIVKLGGAPIDTMDELLARLRRYRAGEPVTVTLLRDQQPLTLDVVI